MLRDGNGVPERAVSDPAGDRDWGISAEVDLAEWDEQGMAVIRVTSADQL